MKIAKKTENNRYITPTRNIPIVDEIATKRLAVKPSTWETLSNLRQPGETFDELLVSLIATEQRYRLSHDLDVAAAEPSIEWSVAAKKLGL